MSQHRTHTVKTPFGITGTEFTAARFDGLRANSLARHVESLPGWIEWLCQRGGDVVAIQTFCDTEIQTADYDGRKAMWQTVISYQDAA